MKFTRLIFLVAVVIIGVWLLGLALKLAAWVIDSLLYIAAVIVIIGLVSAYIEHRKKSKAAKQ